MKTDLPIITGISAASGIVYGVRLVEFLLKKGYKTELIISSKAYYIARQELGIELSHSAEEIKKSIESFLKMKTDLLKVWLDDEIWANPASGSYKTMGMIIAPASMATISAITHGHAENLISRAADVCLKEKRLLTVVPRETPLNSIHLENMLKLSSAGVNIVPPIFGHYSKIKTLTDGINFVTGKVLDAHKIDNNLYERWNYE